MSLKWIKKSLLFWGAVLMLASGCTTRQSGRSALPEKIFSGQTSVVKYARFFDLYRAGNMSKLVIHSPFEGEEDLVYYLVDTTRGEQPAFRGEHVFFVPFSRVGVLSATQLDGLKRMGLLDRVAGISDAQYIRDQEVKKRIEKEEIKEIAAGNVFFTEKALMMDLGAVFFSPFKKGQQLMVKNSVPVIPFFDFMESSPLGRAEWVKFSAAFFGKGEQADTLFGEIAREYNRLKKMTDTVRETPSVFSGKYFNGQWYVPGGKSYVATIFQDAGADYVFKTDSSVNSVALDFEVVYHRAKDADFWRITGGIDTLNFYGNLASANDLYTRFKAFKKHQVIYCDPQATGYFEKGTLEPQVVLADFIHVFHPEILPDHHPVYYRLIP